ncbi:DNA polymerase IV [Nocardia camponoti]|uniref:DNA polymerase IV n=1 Tax=Nocardia camponoti TaxID=1616106 RepID=A0A917QL17_9NOCA|nr:DNA polymerase IV [Nocardia camponoti]
MEFRRRPQLRGQPVIVGGNGDPTEARKVVTCASYPARGFGVRAGMPLRQAVRKCPDGVFLPVDLAFYQEVSDDIMATLGRVAGGVEVLGMDEAFVATTADPWALANEIRSAITEIDLTCAVGIGDNKLTAKLATGFAKQVGKKTAEPSNEVGAATGIFELTAANWRELMGERPTSALWGIGSRIAKRMEELGIATVNDLMAADPAVLAAEFGPNTGPYLRVLGHGLGDTELVTQPRIPVGHSKSETFPTDLTDRDEIRGEVARLAGAVAEEMAAEGRVSTRVSVTVRTKSFQTRSKQKKLAEPTADVAAIVDAATDIIDRFEIDRPVRLLGVRVEMLPID